MKNRKRLFLLLMSVVMVTLGTSCSKDDVAPKENEDQEKSYLDATSMTTWHYISAKDNKVIGTGEHGTDDAAWAERTDWDFAIQRFKVKTNSGTSGEGKSGLYTFGKDVKFGAITSLAANTEYTVDTKIDVPQMDGSTISESKSSAVVSVMQGGMPPTWDKSPIYAIRSADGGSVYKIEFTQYKNDKGESGCVKYNIGNIAIDPVKVNTMSVDATSMTTWHYISSKDNKVIGTGEQNTDDAAWEKRTDWDFAIQRFKVKTNSGTSGEGKSGLYTFGKDIKFDAITSLAANTEYTVDTKIEVPQMDGSTISESKSLAVVSVMQGGMPPTWMKSPIYAIRSADGESVYKIEFTQYKNDKGKSGYVKYNIAEI